MIHMTQRYEDITSCLLYNILCGQGINDMSLLGLLQTVYFKIFNLKYFVKQKIKMRTAIHFGHFVGNERKKKKSITKNKKG